MYRGGGSNMVFQGQKLSDIREQHLERLVNDQVQERDTIEYKKEMYGQSDEEKREMLKDITSMANYHGGYLIIGVEEDNEGIPTGIFGIEAGNHVERITNSCLDNIDKRIVGLEVEDVSLSNGKSVVVISIPESINAPHMVTFKGLNQFWKRHGRQKDRMTIDEIGEAFDKRLSDLNRLDRFLFVRKAEILESIGEETCMVISSSPAYLRDEAIFDIHDEDLRGMVLNPPRLAGGMGDISCGQPYPTINGLRADNRSPYYSDEPLEGNYIEVFSTGYVEYGELIKYDKWVKGDSELGLYFASLGHTASVVNFMRFIEKLYGIYLPLTPVVVHFAIYNARGMWLATEGQYDRKIKWQKQHLELGKFYAENLSEEYKLLTKKICDQLWQAFHREKANVFDDAGTFQTR